MAEKFYIGGNGKKGSEGRNRKGRKSNIKTDGIKVALGRKG